MYFFSVENLIRNICGSRRAFFCNLSAAKRLRLGKRTDLKSLFLFHATVVLLKTKHHHLHVLIWFVHKKLRRTRKENQYLEGKENRPKKTALVDGATKKWSKFKMAGQKKNRNGMKTSLRSVCEWRVLFSLANNSAGKSIGSQVRRSEHPPIIHQRLQSNWKISLLETITIKMFLKKHEQQDNMTLDTEIITVLITTFVRSLTFLHVHRFFNIPIRLLQNIAAIFVKWQIKYTIKCRAGGIDARYVFWAEATAVLVSLAQFSFRLKISPISIMNKFKWIATWKFPG